jgi:hypothetical protein
MPQQKKEDPRDAQKTLEPRGKEENPRKTFREPNGTRWNIQRKLKEPSGRKDPDCEKRKVPERPEPQNPSSPSGYLGRKQNIP